MAKGSINNWVPGAPRNASCDYNKKKCTYKKVQRINYDIVQTPRIGKGQSTKLNGGTRKVCPEKGNGPCKTYKWSKSTITNHGSKQEKGVVTISVKRERSCTSTWSRFDKKLNRYVGKIETCSAPKDILPDSGPHKTKGVAIRTIPA